jgi:hypothetical protein
MQPCFCRAAARLVIGWAAQRYATVAARLCMPLPSASDMPWTAGLDAGFLPSCAHALKARVWQQHLQAMTLTSAHAPNRLFAAIKTQSAAATCSTQLLPR